MAVRSVGEIPGGSNGKGVHAAWIVLQCAMLVGTHALLPVCACLAIDHASVLAGRERLFQPSVLWWVAGFGVLPDLCSPHLSLDDRHASIPHTVWFLAAIAPVALLAGYWFRNGSGFRAALAFWLASASHLAADAVSGGIAWLYPWKEEVIGGYFVDLDWWLWSDAIFVVLAWLMYRILPHLEARNIQRSFSP